VGRSGRLFVLRGALLSPGYHNNLVSQWLPALDGVVDKLERGAKVADVGRRTQVSIFVDDFFLVHIEKASI
jgi:hypothetical protein